MTILSPTLRSLVSLGFERRRPASGMKTVGYRLRDLDLTASDGANKYDQPVVHIAGIVDTGRTLGQIESELPQDLETTKAAAAWLSFALRDWKHDLMPPPDWLALGEQNWDLIPHVRRQREYEMRQRCAVKREHARLFRREIRRVLEQLPGNTNATVSFDGRVLAVRLDDACVETLAEGDAWSLNVLWPVSADTQLPNRFREPSVSIGFFDGLLEISNHRYSATEVRA